MFTPPPLSVYIHLPWCVKKCPYCDFNSYQQQGGLPQRRYLAALLHDIDYAAAGRQYAPVQSIFFGGGTPSLFSPQSIAAVLDALRERFDLADDCEISLEANPGAVAVRHLEGYRQAGVNRLSIGVQSLDDSSLRALGRIHDAAAARRAVQQAQDCGFDNINIDLMYGLPRQRPGQALLDLQRALALRPMHLSWYQLTIEPNTAFYAKPPPLPDDDALWRMSVQGDALLGEHGFERYEVSAYSQPGYRCRHNRNYWRFGDYLGLGAGAHGKLSASLDNNDNDGIQIIRSVRQRQPARYMRTAGRPAVLSQQHAVPAAERLFEFMLNALRLRRGVPVALLEQRTGLALAAVRPALQAPIMAGLLHADARRIQATRRGYRYLDDLTAYFLPAPGLGGDRPRDV